MAIVDNTLVFSDGQAITADAGSTNIIDTLAPGTPYGYSAALTKDNGIGHDVPILVSVTEAFNTLTSLTVSLQVDNDVAFGSPKTVATSGAIPLASLTLGYQFKFPAELLEGTDERYIRLYYDVTGTNPTLGKIFAGVVGGRQTA
jgi:hypothetical protein